MAVKIEDLQTAIEWLESNEGPEGEAESCFKVANWLKDEIQARQLSAIAREHKVSMKTAREIWSAIQ